MSPRKRARITAYRVLRLLESLYPDPIGKAEPPTFVLGAPRSGTTLAMLVLSDTFSVSYFSRFATDACLYTGRPQPRTTAALTRVVRRFRRKSYSFENTYGSSTSYSQPKESEPLWEHLFGSKYDCVEPSSLSEIQRESIRKVICATATGFGGLPFVDKATTASVRILALNSVFPEALFVNIKRDRLATAQSILVARKTRFPTWIGGRPAECLKMQDCSLEKQVCAQIYYIEAGIRSAKELLGKDRFLDVSYEDICSNPGREMERVMQFMERHGIHVKKTAAMIDPFTESRGLKVSASEFRTLRQEFEILDERQAGSGR